MVTFLVFAGFRAFLYGVMGAYIGDIFGPATLGRVTGCVFTTGSLIQILQAPIIDAMNRYGSGDTGVLAMGILAVGFMMVVPVEAAAGSGAGNTKSDKNDHSNSSHRVSAAAEIEFTDLPKKTRRSFQ